MFNLSKLRLLETAHLIQLHVTAADGRRHSRTSQRVEKGAFSSRSASVTLNMVDTEVSSMGASRARSVSRRVAGSSVISTHAEAKRVCMVLTLGSARYLYRLLLHFRDRFKFTTVNEGRRG